MIVATVAVAHAAYSKADGRTNVQHSPTLAKSRVPHTSSLWNDLTGSPWNPGIGLNRL